MKAKYIMPGLLCSFALFTGCTNNSLLAPFWPTTNGPVAVVASDSEIIGELVVLNKAEIAAAKIAKVKARSFKVKNYAAYLYKQHNANLHQVLKLSRQENIKPVMNATALNLEEHSKQEGAKLNALSSRDFDRVYIDDMIQDHKTALSLLDVNIAHSSNPKLVRLLKETRHHVAMHLRKAEHIRHELTH